MANIPKYKERFVKEAYVACQEGFTDVKLAKLFGVSKQSINGWKRKFPAFKEALQTGKDEFNVAVAENCLIKRLKGYAYTETTKELVTDKETGKKELVITKEVRKSVAPDTTALIFFLKNRDHERWCDRREIAGTLTIEDAINAIEGGE
jgi:hypothetical protein